MLLAGSIDEEIYSLINNKRAVVNQATEGGSSDSDASTSDLVMRMAFEFD